MTLGIKHIMEIHKYREELHTQKIVNRFYVTYLELLEQILSLYVINTLSSYSHCYSFAAPSGSNDVEVYKKVIDNLPLNIPLTSCALSPISF